MVFQDEFVILSQSVTENGKTAHKPEPWTR